MVCTNSSTDWRGQLLFRGALLSLVFFSGIAPTPPERTFALQKKTKTDNKRTSLAGLSSYALSSIDLATADMESVMGQLGLDRCLVNGECIPCSQEELRTLRSYCSNPNPHRQRIVCMQCQAYQPPWQCKQRGQEQQLWSKNMTRFPALAVQTQSNSTWKNFYQSCNGPQGSDAALPAGRLLLKSPDGPSGGAASTSKSTDDAGSIGSGSMAKPLTNQVGGVKGKMLQQGQIPATVPKTPIQAPGKISVASKELPGKAPMAPTPKTLPMLTVPPDFGADQIVHTGSVVAELLRNRTRQSGLVARRGSSSNEADEIAAVVRFLALNLTVLVISCCSLRMQQNQLNAQNELTLNDIVDRGSPSKSTPASSSSSTAPAALSRKGAADVSGGPAVLGMQDAARSLESFVHKTGSAIELAVKGEGHASKTK